MVATCLCLYPSPRPVVRCWKMHSKVLLILIYLAYFQDKVQSASVIKGIVHLNSIFPYMKFNKICNLDHPVY